MGRKLRIVLYAVNGSGTGHLTRLVAIARWLRRYSLHAGVHPEIVFLTSSEADGLLFAEHFASFKLPSKTIIADAGMDKLTYLALAKQWVWHSLGLLQPDLLVVDTFPRGSFGELLSALDLCRHKAFVYRPVKDSFAARADFQAMLPLYDAIVVPEHRESVELRVPEAVQSRVSYVGPVLARERPELAEREEARRRLGVAADARVVYVSAGGGGDPNAERALFGVIDALKEDPRFHVVVAAGPLYRSRPVYRERLTWLAQHGAVELMPGCDVAVSAAGYNTFHELMFAGIPTLFFVQEKIADEQRVRAERALRVGAAELVPKDAPSLVEALLRLSEPHARATAAEAARRLIPKNHAREAAAELLRLVLPASEVEAAEDAVSDELLEAARNPAVPLEKLLELARLLEDSAVGSGRKRDSARGTERARALLLLGAELELPPDALLGVVGILVRKLTRASVAERAGVAHALLGELASFGDWNGARALLKLLPVDRQLPPVLFAREVTRLLAALRANGDDLYRGIAALSRAQTQHAEPSSAAELLSAAVAELTRNGAHTANTEPA